nr:uncharacterized protein LOC126539698 [Dermacentor andersoni]
MHIIFLIYSTAFAQGPLQWSISSTQGGWRRAPAAQSRSDSPIWMAPSSQGNLPGIPFPELHLDSPRWIAQHSQESCLGVQAPAAQTYSGIGHAEFATQCCHLELPRWPASSSQGNHCPALVSQLHHKAVNNHAFFGGATLLC